MPTSCNFEYHSTELRAVEYKSNSFYCKFVILLLNMILMLDSHVGGSCYVLHHVLTVLQNQKSLFYFWLTLYVFFCRAIALPLSTKLGVRDKQRPKVQPNPILETFYSTCRKNPEEVSPFFLRFPVDLVSLAKENLIWNHEVYQRHSYLEAQQRKHCSTGYLRAAGQEGAPAMPSALSSASEHQGGNCAPKRNSGSSCSLLTIYTAWLQHRGLCLNISGTFLLWGCPGRLWNLYPRENSKHSGHGLVTWL